MDVSGCWSGITLTGRFGEEEEPVPAWECNSFDHNRNILFELYQTHTHVAHQDSDTTQDNVHMEISQVSCWKLHLETNKSTETTVQAFTTKLLSFWVQELEGLCRSPC